MLQLSHGIDNLVLLAEQIAGGRPQAELPSREPRSIARRPVPAGGIVVIR